MDSFLNRVRRAAEMADAEALPPPLDPERILAKARLAGLPASRSVSSPSVPWRFVAGLGAAAAGFAVVVGVFALLVRDRAADPYAALALFMDVLS